MTKFLTMCKCCKYETIINLRPRRIFWLGNSRNLSTCHKNKAITSTHLSDENIWSSLTIIVKLLKILNNGEWTCFLCQNKKIVSKTSHIKWTEVIFPHVRYLDFSSIRNCDLFSEVGGWIGSTICLFVISDFLPTEVTGRQAKEEGEEWFESWLMNKVASSVAPQLIMQVAHKNRFQGLLCHASPLGWWGMGVIRVGGSGWGLGLNRWKVHEHIIRYACNSL